MLDHLDRPEGHVDRPRIGEDMRAQPIEILFLGILRIGNLGLHLDAPLPFLALDDLSRDDEGIITEHHLQKVDVLFFIGRTEILDIIQDELPLPEI